MKDNDDKIDLLERLKINRKYHDWDNLFIDLGESSFLFYETREELIIVLDIIKNDIQDSLNEL